MEPSITDLLNKTMVRVEQTTDAHGEDALVMETDDGMVYTFAGARDCCESVTINDITMRVEMTDAGRSVLINLGGPEVRRLLGLEVNS